MFGTDEDLKKKNTLPLAERPVNQMVIPRWPKSSERSVASTAPVDRLEVSDGLGRRGRTRVEGDVGGHGCRLPRRMLQSINHRWGRLLWRNRIGCCSKHKILIPRV